MRRIDPYCGQPCGPRGPTQQEGRGHTCGSSPAASDMMCTPVTAAGIRPRRAPAFCVRSFSSQRLQYGSVLRLRRGRGRRYRQGARVLSASHIPPGSPPADPADQPRHQLKRRASRRGKGWRGRASPRIPPGSHPWRCHPSPSACPGCRPSATAEHSAVSASGAPQLHGGLQAAVLFNTCSFHCSARKGGTFTSHCQPATREDTRAHTCWGVGRLRWTRHHRDPCGCGLDLARADGGAPAVDGPDHRGCNGELLFLARRQEVFHAALSARLFGRRTAGTPGPARATRLRSSGGACAHFCTLHGSAGRSCCPRHLQTHGYPSPRPREHPVMSTRFPPTRIRGRLSPSFSPRSR